MGGEVSKKTFEEDCKSKPGYPPHFREVIPGLFAFGLPFSKEVVGALKDHQPSLSVLFTLLDDPLLKKKGEEVPPEHKGKVKIVNTDEWFWADQDLVDELESGLELKHIPIEDGGLPTCKQLCYFVRETRLALLKNKGVGMHCWMGRGRTSVFLGAYYAAHLRILDPEHKDAQDFDSFVEAIWPFAGKARLPDHQLKWLKSFFENPDPHVLAAFNSAMENKQ